MNSPGLYSLVLGPLRSGMAQNGSITRANAWGPLAIPPIFQAFVREHGQRKKQRPQRRGLR